MLRESQRAVLNETRGMTADTEAYLIGLGTAERARLQRDAQRALRAAWSHRHSSFRAPYVVRANVVMLRNLRSI